MYFEYLKQWKDNNSETTSLYLLISKQHGRTPKHWPDILSLYVKQIVKKKDLFLKSFT